MIFRRALLALVILMTATVIGTSQPSAQIIPMAFWSSGGVVGVGGQALRFRTAANTCLRRTMTGNANRWTWSGWIKSTNTSTQYGGLFETVMTTGQGQQGGIGFSNDGPNRLTHYNYHPTYTYTGGRKSTAMMFRDPSAWYHVVTIFDNTAAVADRIRIYINGVRVTNFNQNTDNSPAYGSWAINTGLGTGIGCQIRDGSTVAYPFDGYMADVYFSDGNAIEPSAFAELDANGTWIPKAFAGAYGTGGFHLEFKTPASLGADTSGLGNNWIPMNFDTTAGSNTYDPTNDAPASGSNYLTLNPLGGPTGSSPIAAGLTSGNTGVSTSTTGGALGTFPIPPGKWYFESKASAPTGFSVGLALEARNLAADPGIDLTNYYGWYFNGSKNWITAGSNPWTSGAYTSANVARYAIDATNPASVKFWVGADATWFNSAGSGVGDPAAGTGATSTISSGLPLYPYAAVRGAAGTSTFNLNFGQSAFAYAAPSGFLPLNVSSLAAPALTDPSPYFKIASYAGNGAYQSIGEPAKQTSPISLANSMRFRPTSTAYLSRTNSITSADNGRQKWTYSAWVKRAPTGVVQSLYSVNVPATDYLDFRFTTTDTLLAYFEVSSLNYAYETTRMFRDPGSWHHIVLAVDSTATAADRVILYIDGVRESTWGVKSGFNAMGPSYSTYANHTYPQAIGRFEYLPANTYMDGYLADVYMVDGSQQPASAFGQADAEGDWVPKAYSGSYGTNGFRLNFADASSVGKDAAGTNNWIANGFTTDDNNPFQFKATGFQVGNNSLINTNTNGYISWNWKKGATPGFDVVTGVSTGTTGTMSLPHSLGKTPSLIIAKNVTNADHWYSWSNTFPNANTYIALNLASGTATASGIFGTGPTSTTLNFGQNNWFSGAGQKLVAYAFAEVPGFSKFGNYTGNGSADGPFVHTGFKPAYILFKNTGAATGWMVYDTARRTINPNDSLLQPSSNVAETNGTEYFDILSNGFKIRFGGSWSNVSGNSYIFAAFAESPFKEQSKAANLDVLNGLRFKTSPITYMNRSVTATGNQKVWTWSGWVKRSGLTNTAQYIFTGGTDSNGNDGLASLYFENNGITTYFDSPTTNPVTTSTALFRDPSTWYHIVWRVDAAANLSQVYVNNTLVQTAAPPNYTYEMNQSGMPMAIGTPSWGAMPSSSSDYYLSNVDYVDGQSLAPSTFAENNTAGLWAPKTYGGTYGTNGFRLDFADSTNLGKDAAGTNNWTANNFTTANSNPFQFKATGFQVGNNALLNTNANNYVSWNWKKGAVPGFDIVNYTGNGAACSVSIPHSLGAVPKFALIKSVNAAGDWAVFHDAMTDAADDYLYLNSTSAKTSYGSWFGKNATNFCLSAVPWANTANVNYVSYLFSEVPGFSKFGTYTGNGAADGPFINTGFKPAYILTKRADSAGNWYVLDAARNSLNPVEQTLFTETNAAEATYTGQVDFTANGFKLRNTHASQNGSGGAYIYAAFAESPFKERSTAASLDVLNGLRFSTSPATYMSRNITSTGNQKVWTWSGWIKRAGLGSGLHYIFSGGIDSNGNDGVVALYFNNDALTTYFDSPSTNPVTTTTALFRDPSAWYHIVWRVDAATSTSQVYVNNVLVQTAAPPNYTYEMNQSGMRMAMGTESWGTMPATLSNYYLANVDYVDGQSLAPSSFAEANSAGAWAPKTYGGTYGTNGFRLEFQNAGALGTDTSGAGNTWTATNFTAADKVNDSPTNNFSTLNPLTYLNGSGPLTTGNLNFGNNVGYWRSIAATQQVPTTGKWYWEASCDNESTYRTCNIGVYNGNYQSTYNMGPGDIANWWAYVAGNGTAGIGARNNNTTIATGYANLFVGDVMQIAYDAATGNMWFGKNNVWQGAGSPNPATGTAPAYTGAYNVIPIASQNWSAHTYNFGQGGVSGLTYDAASGGSFKYAPPSGFKALSTKNIAASPVPNPALYFKPATHTGTGATQQTINVGFQPDLTWIKDRTGTNGHVLEDSSRVGGTSPYLQSNTNAAEIKLFSPSSADNVNDTPTNNYATLNPLASAGVDANFTASSGNLALTVLNNSGYRQYSGTFAPEGLKGYFEVEMTTGTPNGKIGFEDITKVISASTYTSAGTFLMDVNSGNIMNGLTGLSTSTGFVTGDVLGVAFDFTGTNKNVWYARNGVWVSGNPASGTSPSLTSANLTGIYRFYFSANTGGGTNVQTYNFGQTPFAYTPPTGFSAMNTTNMLASSIQNPASYFKAVTYTGTAANQTVNVGFQPDLTWIKDRTTTNTHVIQDSERVGGTSPYLQSNATAAEIPLYDPANTDNVTDVPTAYNQNHGNFPILNPLTLSIPSSGNGTLINGDLKFTGNSTVSYAFGTIPFPTTGKYYWEAKVDAVNVASTGLIYAGLSQGITGTTADALFVQYTYTGACGAGCAVQQISNYTGGSQTNVASTGVAANDVFGFAVDMDTGKAWVARNGTWYASGSPASGANPNKTFTNLPANRLYAWVGGRETGNAATVNFGQRGWAYGPPDSTFKPVNSFYYTNSEFKPDLVLTKARTGAFGFAWYDTTRGTLLELDSSSNGGQVSSALRLSTYQPGGFTVGSSGKANTAATNYISYMFKEGTTPGFDIVTYTGNGANNRTIAHNLGVAPAFYITKNIDGYNAGQGYLDWSTYHKNIPTGGSCSGGPNNAWLHQPLAPSSGAGGFCSVPTSSVFSPNQINYDNSSGRTYVAYLFAEVPGFSKFGTYTGNGSVDGPFVYTGFKPAFVMLKRIDGGSEQWLVYDNVRTPYNGPGSALMMNTSSAEEATAPGSNSNALGDFTANGFKVRSTGGSNNTSGGTYIYMAIAENPFKYNLAK